MCGFEETQRIIARETPVAASDRQTWGLVRPFSGEGRVMGYSMPDRR